MRGNRPRSQIPWRSLRIPARILFVGVLALDVLVVLVLIGGGGYGMAGPQQQPEAATAEAPTEPEQPVYDRQALSLLAREMAERAAALERRETELDEALRGAEVLRRAGLTPQPAEPEDAEAGTLATPDANAEPVAPSPQETEARENFERLQRAYANMEPESAALALSELAGRDRDAVVELLIGWQPRVSGAILDALTQLRPALAAELTYEIWKRSESGT